MILLFLSFKNQVLNRIKFLHFYILLIASLAACKLTKNVPEGKYLIKKNKIVVEGEKMSATPLYGIIRQPENTRFLGLKIKLGFYNIYDSTKVANKRQIMDIKIREKNKKKQAREDKVDTKRKTAAREIGDSTYVKKTIPKKDTIEPRMFFKEWVKYKLGEPPVILDTSLYIRTLSQLNNYMKRKGYYYSSTAGVIDFQDNKKAIVTYTIQTGARYYIDTFQLNCPNESVAGSITKYINKQDKSFLTGRPLDADYLNTIRTRIAKHLKDDAFYGFSPASITFEADSNNLKDNKLNIAINVADRLVRSEENRDSLVSVPYKVYHMRNVYFHLSDSTLYKGNLRRTIVDSLGLPLSSGQFLTTIDTFYYAEIYEKNSSNGEKQLDQYRMAIFTYNGEMFVKPKIIESQNYLEHTNYYKDYYLDRSYSRLLDLGVFQVVKPVFEEIKNTDSLDIHYYLIPVKKRSFGLEPRATTSNGYLGISASINYIDKNIWRSATKMTISLAGGIESQPPIFDKTVDGDKIKTSARAFNTFEFGPSIKFEIPGIFPIPITNISKRAKPKTQISLGFNVQQRTDFTRNILQTNYLWKFFVGKSQIFTVGLPTSSVIKIVKIDKSEDFKKRINDLNDLFLQNAYSSQLIWQDIKLTFEFNDKNLDKKRLNPFDKGNLYNQISFDPAGLFLSAFNSKLSQDTNGRYLIANIPYSQFVRIDEEVIYSYPFSGLRSLHLHGLAGFGKPYGNSSTSLPYDYAFFAGGANDNRGWKARTLGPGSYKYYLDTNRTATQIGDIRIGGSIEYRFNLGGPFRGAVFTDAGNIWLINNDVKRPGGQFSKNWINDIAVAGGVGIRYDFVYFVLRVDLGFPLRNPALPDGAKWITQSRDPYLQEIQAGKVLYGDDFDEFLPKPFKWQLHFGINYPF